jgi:transposase-like protein
MKENQPNLGSKKKFSEEEKRSYCAAWERSDLNRTAFCMENGISRSALYQWSKQFKKEDSESGFSPLVMSTKASVTNMTQLTITSGGEDCVQLKLTLPEHRLVSFIKEMCNAITVVR